MIKFILKILFLMSVCPTLALAEISVQSVVPTSNWNYTLLEDASASDLLAENFESWPYYFLNFQINTVASPLIQFDALGNNRTEIIEQLTTADFLIKRNLSKSLSLIVNGSANLVEQPNRSDLGLGDLRMAAERTLRDIKENSWGVSVLGEVFLPTGDRNLFLSSGTPGFGINSAWEKKWSRLNIVLNLGYTFRPNAIYRNIDYREQLKFGAGGSIALNQRININLEASTSLLAKDAMSQGPGDLYLGGSYRTSRNSRVHFGASAGNVQQDGSSSLRFLFGYKSYLGADPTPVPALKRPPTVVPIAKPQIIVRNVVEKQKIVERSIIQGAGCRSTSNTFIAPARNLTASEDAQFQDLPYISTSKKPLKRLRLGEMTNLSGETPIVSNAQTVFAIDLDGLPNILQVEELVSAYLKMKTNTLKPEGRPFTEMLCFLNDRQCSGELADDKTWEDNLNQVFLKNRTTPNDYFTTQLSETSLGSVGNLQLHSANLSLDLRRLLQNSLAQDLKPRFYNLKSGEKKTLYFSVGKDTFVANDTNLKITIRQNSCNKGSN